MLKAHGWQVGNADVTLICEAPRIGPHVQGMRNVLATELGATIDAISVKATTTEGLGFCGRGEGIAAMDEYLATAPNNPVILFSKFKILVNFEKWDEAQKLLPLLDKAYSYTDQNWEYMEDIAELKEKLASQNG